jgi:hypothetical protein
MECVYCRRWHWLGVLTCNAPGAPKPEHKHQEQAKNPTE